MRKAPQVSMTGKIMVIFFTVSNLLSRKEAEKSFAIFSRKIFGFSRTGSGTRSTHLPGRRGGRESESLRAFNTRQESGKGTRVLGTGSRSVLQYGTRIRDWVPLSRR